MDYTIAEFKNKRTGQAYKCRFPGHRSLKTLRMLARITRSKLTGWYWGTDDNLPKL